MIDDSPLNRKPTLLWQAMFLGGDALHNLPQDTRKASSAGAFIHSTEECARFDIWTRGVDVVARVLFNLLGTLFLLVGILGVVLPLLPATPFLLLASACYVRGSQALHRWLMSNKYLGTYITNIKDNRSMPRKAKIMTIAVLWASLLFSLSRVDSLLVDMTLLMVGLGITALIVRLKTVGQRCEQDHH